MPAYGKSGEMQVLSMFKSALDGLNVKATTDDPQIEFSYKNSDWTAKQLHPREAGPVVRGVSHNSDLVIWHGNDYVAYVQVKHHAKDLSPDLSREFLGRAIWNQVDDALMISTMSTINRWQLLDRYAIMNTRHLLEAKDKGIQLRDWAQFTVKAFLQQQLGSSRTQNAVGQQSLSRKGKVAELLRNHPSFDGTGFKFVRESLSSYRLLTDGEYVAHSPFALFRASDKWFLVVKVDSIGIPELYQTLAWARDLGVDETILLTAEYANDNAKTLTHEMGFTVASAAEISEKHGVNVDHLPIYSKPFTKYPLKTQGKPAWKAFPDCIQKALEGVPDGIFESACLLANLSKAFGLEFNQRSFVTNCWKKINENWLGYEPAKTLKDTSAKVMAAAGLVRKRKSDPASIESICDIPTIMGPKALDELFHLQLTRNCLHCRTDPRGDVLSYAMSQFSEQKMLYSFFPPP